MKGIGEKEQRIDIERWRGKEGVQRKNRWGMEAVEGAGKRED